jgi:N-carbamoyl-L-amino-acid hydrolase
VEHEWTEPAHIAAGASVLAQVLRDLALADRCCAAEA